MNIFILQGILSGEIPTISQSEWLEEKIKILLSFEEYHRLRVADRLISNLIFDRDRDIEGEAEATEEIISAIWSPDSVSAEDAIKYLKMILKSL